MSIPSSTRLSRTLLLPLDGSDKDRWAVPVGAAFAELTGCDILAVRVIDPSLDDQQADLARLNLRAAAEQLVAVSGRRVALEVIEGTDTADELLRIADEREVELVVMATRATSALERVMRGSVADQMVRESRRPIVVAPPGTRYMRDKQLHLRRVLVPTDGSTQSLSVVTHLTSWPLARELEMVLFEAVEPESTGGYMLPEPMPSRAASVTYRYREESVEWIHVVAERAEEQLESAATELRSQGMTVDVRVVEERDPALAILDATRQELVELIAMTTHGEGGMKRMILGSVAESVVRGSELPVLLVTDGVMRPPSSRRGSGV